MRSIHIKASREYDVLVERGLLDRAGELLREVSAPGMAAIVSDDTGLRALRRAHGQGP